MTGRYANIIADISHEKLDRTFQYIIPDALQGRLEPGTAVMIPFGAGNKLIRGYVMEITDRAEYDVGKLKSVESVIEDAVTPEGDALRLAGWIKEHYGSTMIAALKTVLPVKRKLKPVVKRTICALEDADTLKLAAHDFEKKHQVAKARLLHELSAQPALPYSLVVGKLGVSPQTLRSLENAGLIRLEAHKAYRNSMPQGGAPGWQKKDVRQLSEAQLHIVNEIQTEYEAGIRGTYLIHGVTGSGKTEVYMELIERVRAMGKQAIVLIPEIALTYQTLIRFYRRFGERVSVMNSRLSPGERSDRYECARRGEIDIMIGPRSALFTPFERLGLVIIDEEHESGYKSESMPKYHAREVAGELCRIKGASLVLGSATPSIETYYRAKQGEIRLFTLKERLAGGALPQVRVEDMRRELKEGNRSIFSRRLYALMAERLEKGEQTMLFLNRRGYAGFVSCRACGHVMKCPHCDVSLSEHNVPHSGRMDGFRAAGRLVCHYCGYETPGVTRCPECGSKYILGFRAGTQQVEELLKKEFPNARVLRMDADTTRTKGSYEKILSAFANEEADILVGSQKIVKGHDIAGVTHDGILAAEKTLHRNDFRAGERTFQLLTQAAGRAGRGTLGGEVVIQTYQPENYAIVHASRQDYEGFFEEELSYRDLMLYPPEDGMLEVLVLEADEILDAARAWELADCAAKSFGAGGAAVIGPSGAGIGKINDVYRFVFYVKHRDYSVLVEVKDALERLIADRQWNSESVQFDFNPMSSY